MRPAIQVNALSPVKRLPAKAGFLALLLVAIFNLSALWLTETSYDRIRATTRAAVDTQQVLAAIERVRVSLLDAEAAQRNYLMTGDASQLAPYEAAAASLNAEIADLRQQVAGNPVHMSLTSGLEHEAKSLLVELGSAIELRRSAGFDAAREALALNSGRIRMDTLRLTLDGMRQEEQRTRDESLQVLRTDTITIRLGVIAMALLNLLLVSFGVVFLWREIRRQTRERVFLAERGRRLSDEVETRTAQLRELSRFLEDVREEEKQRVARELHDELGGTLTAAKIDLQLMGDRMHAEPAVAARMQRVNAALDDAITVKRRIIEELRPTLLDNLGIGAALRWQCEQFMKRTGCRCSLRLAEQDLQLSPELSIATYRIVQEALTNVTKYAKAKSVEVHLDRDGPRWHLRVHDDGVGLDIAKQHHPTSHGLISIRERVRSLGGELRISGGPGLGTTIDAWFPYVSAAEWTGTMREAHDETDAVAPSRRRAPGT